MTIQPDHNQESVEDRYCPRLRGPVAGLALAMLIGFGYAVYLSVPSQQMAAVAEPSTTGQGESLAAR
jgi:hypothetical protein